MPIGSTILDETTTTSPTIAFVCFLTIEEASLSRKILMITCAPGLWWRVWHAR